MTDLMLDVGGRRFEVTRTYREALAYIAPAAPFSISGTRYRTGRAGWAVEVAVGSFALFIGYQGNTRHAAA